MRNFEVRTSKFEVRRLVTVALLVTATLGAQTPPQQPPVFRGGTTVVPLTVTVTDQKGVPVKDLKASDFTVIENKKPQEIVNFFPQELVAGPAPAETEISPARKVRDDSVKPQTRRVFLIVLGYGRIEYPTKALEGAIEFVRQRLLPQDAVGVMAFHRTTALTTNHERVAQILERYLKAHEAIVGDVTRFREMSRSPIYTPPGTRAGPSGAIGGAPIPDAILKRIDEVFLGSVSDRDRSASPFLRDTTDMLLGMDRIVPVVEKGGQHQETLAEILKTHQDNGDEVRDTVLISTRLKLYAGVEYLRPIDGDKHLLFFAQPAAEAETAATAPRGTDRQVLAARLVYMSGDGIAKDADDARVVAQRATDARVIVDFIATGGGGGDPNGRIVAEQSGGYYTSLEMASKAVAKVDESTRFSYLLGYAPSNATLDGRYRDVEVRVNRPDVTVRFSHGYFAAADPPPLEWRALVTTSRIEVAMGYDQQAREIPLQVTLSQQPRMGIAATVRVEIVIDAKPLRIPLENGMRVGQLVVRVYCADAKQAVIGDAEDVFEINEPEATYQQWLQTGIRRTIRVPASGAPKYVKVVVYDYGSDRVGSAMVTVK